MFCTISSTWFCQMQSETHWWLFASVAKAKHILCLRFCVLSIRSFRRLVWFIGGWRRMRTTEMKKKTHEYDVHYITFELNIDLVASSFDFLALIDLSRIRFFFMRRNAAKTLNGTNTWDEDYMKEERWNVGPRQYQSQQAHTGRDTLHLLAASCCWSRHRRRCSGYFFSSSLLLCLLVSLGFWSCFRCMSGSCWRFTIFRTLTTAARTYSSALRSTLHRAHPIQTDSKRKC